MLRTDPRSLLVAAGLALSLAPLACGGDDTGDDGASEPTTSSTSAGEPGSEASTRGGEPEPSTGGAATETGDEPPAGSGSGSETGEPPPACAAEVACEDEIILDLGFVEGVVSEGAVESTPEGDGFVSSIDASAGGLPSAPMNPWTYLRFTDAGLERVDIDDLQSLDSHDWHIAAKRFAIRLNSGTGGPSCVHAAAVDGAAYDDVTEVPAGAELEAEAFFDDACTLVDDGSGQGAPAYLLTPWWTYAGCVATTGVPFVLELPDGRALKLVIDAYYAEGQAECNATGAMGQDSAHFTWRWSFLE